MKSCELPTKCINFLMARFELAIQLKTKFKLSASLSPSKVHNPFLPRTQQLIH